MLTLLALDARVLLRGWRSYAPALLIAGIPALIFTATAENEDNIFRAAWITGTAAVIGAGAWFILLSQVERLAALAPVAPRLRALHHVALATGAALPTALIGGLLSDPLRGAAAGLILLFGLVLLSIVIDGLSRLPALAQGLVAAAFFFAPAGAVGAQILSRVDPVLLALYAAATAALILLYLSFRRGLEYGTAYAWRNDASSSVHSRRTIPPGATGLLSRDLRPARAAILFKAAWRRPVVALAVAFVLIFSTAPDAGITAVILLYMGMMWPLHVWKGFQAAPIPRVPAFLALVGPLVLLWIASMGLMAACMILQADAHFIAGDPEGNNHLLDRARASSRLADDPSAAALQTSVHLQEMFGIRAKPSEILALRPPGTERTTKAWLAAVEAHYRPQIARVNVWTSILTALGVLVVVAFFAGMYFLSRHLRPLHSILYILAVVLLVGLPLMKEWNHANAFLRDLVMARPALFATGLAVVFAALIVRYTFVFRRLEPDNLAWLVKSN